MMNLHRSVEEISVKKIREVTDLIKAIFKLDINPKEDPEIFSLQLKINSLKLDIKYLAKQYESLKSSLQSVIDIKNKYYKELQETKGQIEKISPLLDDIYMNAKLDKNCVLMSEILEIKLHLGVFDESIWLHGDKEDSQ